MTVSSFAFPFICTLPAPGALTGAPSVVLKNTCFFISIRRKNPLIKNTEKPFFLVFWFIKPIKHLDHDPAETENAPFIKVFGHDYPLLCNLSPRSGQPVYWLELIAFNSHFTLVLLKARGAMEENKTEQLPRLCPTPSDGNRSKGCCR